MLLRSALLASATLLAPALAAAEDRGLPAMLDKARACLSQISGQRGADGQMAGLARKIASDIDYAEAWSRRDAATAARYLAAAQDCPATIAAWQQAHGPKGSLPLKAPEPTRRADVHWQAEDTPRAPDLSFLVTGRARRAGTPPPAIEHAAAWEQPYGR